jgi:ATP-dependent DNA helicase RecG
VAGIKRACKEYMPYIRKFANTVVALHEDEHELYSLASKMPFDDCINLKAKLTDLRLSLIQSFLADINSNLVADSANLEFSKLCQRLQIIDTILNKPRSKNQRYVITFKGSKYLKKTI